MSELAWWQVAGVILAVITVLSILGTIVQEVSQRIVDFFLGWSPGRCELTQAIYKSIVDAPTAPGLEHRKVGDPMTLSDKEKYIEHINKCVTSAIRRYVETHG